jgi:hypothetical protein
VKTVARVQGGARSATTAEGVSAASRRGMRAALGRRMRHLHIVTLLLLWWVAAGCAQTLPSAMAGWSGGR